LRPLVLAILDGWGLSVETKGNAVFSTPTPNYDKLLSMFPSTSLHASGEEVGLEWGEMGNSEVGHLNLGTGRVVMQDLPRIDKSIADKTFFVNKELVDAFNYAKQNNTKVHLLGLCSSGGVHAHINHLLALIDLAKLQNFTEVYIHVITDGRDTAPKTILSDLPKLQAKITQTGVGKIASVMGRFYGMDRDKRVERTRKAFNILTSDSSPTAETIEKAINDSYAAGKTDEFIEPTKIGNTARIKSKDAVIFYNFRSDRARQISDELINIPEIYFASFTSYGHEPTPLVKVAFLADKVTDQLAMVLSSAKLTQLHIAETEKYAHVTYFFNGGWEAPFAGEERIVVPSPKVATYDLKPEMSADELTAKFIEYFQKNKPNFTVLNFANADMVGHTGILAATQKAVAKVDNCLGKLAQAVLNAGGDLLVTADHGNAEQMINLQTGEVDKEHTINPVPLLLCFQEKINQRPVTVNLDTKLASATTEPIGVLADVTATVINRLGLNQPEIVTGQDLSQVI